MVRRALQSFKSEVAKSLTKEVTTVIKRKAEECGEGH